MSNTAEVRRRLTEQLKRELGDVIIAALEDSKVVEIMLNADGQLWTERLGEGMRVVGRIEAVQAENLICTVASALGTEATREKPIIEGELPLDGSRFEALISPCVERPIFAIRKRAQLIYTLEHYVRDGIMTEAQALTLKSSVAKRKNILVVGSTGSGKTTLCNALLNCVAETDPFTRIAIIEDTRELQCSVENKASLRTSDTVTMTHLLRACMRLRPDRIVVGEVRGPEALSLIKAWNTGHPGGVATIHANSASAGLLRLEQLVQEANVPPDPRIIAEVMNVVVSIQRTNSGRKIEEIALVKGYKDNNYLIDYI